MDWIWQLLIEVLVWLVTVTIVARWRFTERAARRAAVARGMIAGLVVGLPVAPLSPDGATRDALLSLLNLPALAAVWVGLSPQAIVRFIGLLARRCRKPLAKWLAAALLVGTGWIPFAVFGFGILGTVAYANLLDPKASAAALGHAGIGPGMIWLGMVGAVLGISAQLFLMAYLGRAAVRLFLRAEGADPASLPGAWPLAVRWRIAYGCLIGVFLAGFATTVAAGAFHIDWGSFHAVI